MKKKLVPRDEADGFEIKRRREIRKANKRKSNIRIRIQFFFIGRYPDDLLTNCFWAILNLWVEVWSYLL